MNVINSICDAATTVYATINVYYAETKTNMSKPDDFCLPTTITQAKKLDDYYRVRSSKSFLHSDDAKCPTLPTMYNKDIISVNITRSKFEAMNKV